MHLAHKTLDVASLDRSARQALTNRMAGRLLAPLRLSAVYALGTVIWDWQHGSGFTHNGDLGSSLTNIGAPYY